MRSAFAGLTESAGVLVSVRRRWVAAIAGLAASAAVLTMALGDVLVAFGEAPLAARMPGNAALASAAILPALAGRNPAPATLALARDALRNSPLATEALAYLAINARSSGDARGSLRLLEIAGMTGWRNEIVQRQLFNAAVRRSSGEAAMRHADALLRQGKARPELFAQFNRALEFPRFRKAALPYFTNTPGWPRDYLVQNGAGLTDTALLEVLRARTSRSGSLARDEAAPLIGALLRAGRSGSAVRVWAMVAGADGQGSGILTWPGVDAPLQPTPFDWRLGDAYGAAPDGSGALVALAAGAPPASRLLALPPGRYRLTTRTSMADLHSWNWAFACGTPDLRPVLPLASGTEIAVPDGCPVQRLTIAPRAEAAGSGASLLPLQIDRLP